MVSWSWHSVVLGGEALGLQVVHRAATRALDGEGDVLAFGQFAAALAAADVIFHLQVSKKPLNLPRFQR